MRTGGSSPTAPGGARRDRDRTERAGLLVHDAVGVLFRVLWGSLLLLVVAVPLLAWRLEREPIGLDALTPMIERALSDERSGLRVTLGRTVLTAGEGARLLDFHAFDLAAYGPDGDQPILTVPDVSFSLNFRALLAGRIAPDTISLTGVRLALVREAGGRVRLGINGGGAEPTPASGAVGDLIRDALLGEPDPAKPGRTLNAFTITRAMVTIEDRGLGRSWQVPEADLTFRRVEAGLTASGRLRLEIESDRVDLALDADYHKGDGSLGLAARVAGLRPARLAGLDPALAGLAAADLPVSGAARARLAADGRLDRLDLDLAAGAGRLVLPAPLAGTLPLTAAVVKGGYQRERDRLDLSEFRVEFGGPTLTASGAVEGLLGGGAVRLEAALRDVPVDRLGELWPQGLAQNARDWVVSNLSKGMAREATLALAGRLPPGGDPAGLTLTRLGGTIRADGVTVDYLHPMPLARGVKAEVTYDAHSMRIVLREGEAPGLRLRGGEVLFTGLDQVDQFAEITLDLGGPLAAALWLLDSPPLRYAQALGIDPGRVGGDTTTRVGFKFPLLQALRLDDLDIHAEASVKGLMLPKVALGQDIEGGQLDLTVDAKGLDAVGSVVLGGVPASLSWRENFAARGAPFRSRYHIKAAQLGEEQRRRFGLDAAPFVAPLLAGPVGADVTVSLGDGGKGEIAARLDLAPARMALAPLGWSKEEGKPGSAEVEVRLERRQLAAVPHFAVQSAGLDVRGTVGFDGEGAARRIEFTRLAVGRSEGGGVLTLPPGGGLDFSFSGASLDLAPALADKSEDGQDKDHGPPLTLSAHARRLWVSEMGALGDASLSFRREGGDFRSLALQGGLEGGHKLSVTIAGDAASRRSLAVHSDDAGAVARAFDLYPDLVGGELTVSGAYDDSVPGHPLTGRLKVTDYQVRNAPALARLLTVAALTGVLDLLRGEGVSFSALEAPFVSKGGLLELKDARAWGPALGITAKGQIDLDRSRLAIEGTVVPAYVLNSALGQIPLLGWLVTGGEEGGGVIAFRYTMKGPADDPSVTVNPLSALTPGFLRRLFNLFDDGSGTEARPR